MMKIPAMKLEMRMEQYSGEIDYCACCEAELLVDDILENFIYISGLGRTCFTCFMKIEHEEVA